MFLAVLLNYRNNDEPEIPKLVVESTKAYRKQFNFVTENLIQTLIIVMLLLLMKLKLNYANGLLPNIIFLE